MLLCCPCICYSLQWVQYLVVPYHYLDKWRLSYCEVPDWHHLERDAQSRKYKFQSEIHEWVCADQAIITILAEPLQDASFNQPSPNSFNDIQEHFSKQVGKINRIGHLQIGLRPTDLPGIVLLHHCGIRFIRAKQFRICKSIMPGLQLHVNDNSKTVHWDNNGRILPWNLTDPRGIYNHLLHPVLGMFLHV